MANDQRFLATAISVRIPVHNEAETIGRLLGEILGRRGMSSSVTNVTPLSCCLTTHLRRSGIGTT
jgi:hypothetical protein